MDFIKKNIWFLLLIVFIFSFFWQFFIQGLLPIPSDTIVGLYNPFLDLYAKISPQGVPFQNFLITDPIRQIIPWKAIVMDNIAGFSLPLWNPYEMAGKPLLANFQSGTFYPFNLLLLIKPFEISWSVFIILQPILSAAFMFLYLRNLKLDARACILGSAAFALGGFSISWMEWGNVIHTALWLPLILLSIDKIFDIFNEISNIKNPPWSLEPWGLGKKLNILLKNKKLTRWFLILLCSSVFSFFAGYLQVFFYIFIVSLAYLIFRWSHNGRNLKAVILFSINYLLFALLTLPQSLPTLQFINLSGRTLDQGPLTSAGWFIPWQNLIQFVAPDFFGNPATLNYWGIWNYAEFSGYVGIVVLFFAIVSLIGKKQKEIYFFLGVAILALIFALPNPISAVPFNLSIPFISSAQPTRLIFLIFTALSILGAFGFANVLARKINLKILIATGFIFSAILLTLWLIVLGKLNFQISAENLLVAKRNLILPTIIFYASFAATLGYVVIKEELTREFLILVIIAISFFDLFRFGSKFTPFTLAQYFYPKTSVIEFLQKQKGIFRIAATDSQILAPNIATFYKLQSIEGYDPLYLYSYAQLIASSERSDHSIKPPFGFNRIITPRNMGSPIINLLNVKYVLTFGDLPKENFKFVFSEGQTKVYENKNVYPRVFFVEKSIKGSTQQLYNQDLGSTAIVSETGAVGNFSKGEARIVSYGENKIDIKTSNLGKGFMVLTDSFYPTWGAEIDGRRVTIYKTDLNFRGVLVPKGNHVIEFRSHLF